MLSLARPCGVVVGDVSQVWDSALVVVRILVPAVVAMSGISIFFALLRGLR